MSSGKDVRQLVEQLENQGWTVTMLRRRSHYKCQAPGGGTVFLPFSPSDWRSILNCRAQLRRMGAQL